MVLRSVALLACLAPAPALARDYGMLGTVFPVEEQSILETIMTRLETMDASGEMAALKSEMQNKTRDYALRPHPVGFVTTTETYRQFEIDLSVRVERDLADQNGVVFARAGTIINPLDYSTFSERIVMIDGDDPDQVAFALSIASEEPTKIILTSGAPLALTKEHGVLFWFDQKGVFARKFQIAHVPAVITRSYPMMLVEEIPASTAAKGETQ